MSPLCVVLGVFHCGYYGVVGFVVYPHSVLSVSAVLTCVTSVLTCVTSVLTCVTSVLTCVTSVLTCVTSVLTCLTSVLTCVTSVLICVTSVLTCVTCDFGHMTQDNSTFYPRWLLSLSAALTCVTSVTSFTEVKISQNALLSVHALLLSAHF